MQRTLLFLFWTAIAVSVAMEFACLLVGQTATTYPTSFANAWQTPGLVIVPNAATSVVAQTTTVDKLLLSNVSAAAVTVTIIDASTNCGGSACQIFPGVSIAANQTYTVNLQGVTAIGGVKWSASSANAIHGWMQGKY